MQHLVHATMGGSRRAGISGVITSFQGETTILLCFTGNIHSFYSDYKQVALGYDSWLRDFCVSFSALSPVLPWLPLISFIHWTIPLSTSLFWSLENQWWKKKKKKRPGKIFSLKGWTIKVYTRRKKQKERYNKETKRISDHCSSLESKRWSSKEWLREIREPVRFSLVLCCVSHPAGSVLEHQSGPT